MTDFGRYPGEAEALPYPTNSVSLVGQRAGFSPTGEWHPEDLEAPTLETPAIGGLGGDTDPYLEAALVEAAPRPAQKYILGKDGNPLPGPDGRPIPVWEPRRPSQPQISPAERFFAAARTAVLGAFAGAIVVVGVGGYLLLNRGGGSTARQPGTITLNSNSTPTAGKTPGVTATPGKTATPGSTPTTQPPTPTTQPPTPTTQPTPKPSPSPAPQPKQPEWGETVDTPTYDGNGNAQGTLTGDQTNMYVCQTADGKYDQLQSPPQGDGAYVRAAQVQLVNGPNSLPICGTANTSSAQANMASLQLNNSVMLVWQRRDVQQPAA